MNARQALRITALASLLTACIAVGGGTATAAGPDVGAHDASVVEGTGLTAIHQQDVSVTFSELW
ncbi:hypothetical protein [Streptomyces sp. NPDC055189]